MKRFTPTIEARVYHRQPVTTKRQVRRADHSLPALVRRLYVTGRHNNLIRIVHRSQTASPAKHKLALLIAAHNEEIVIEQTISSAIAAGLSHKHIYVVDDNSSDATAAIARRLLGADNVVSVSRSGKGLALTKAAATFQLVHNYEWIHIADADGGFARDYFEAFVGSLNDRFAAATGYIRSLPGGPVSQYRVVEYTLGMEIQRRFQSATNTIAVIPGPTSCFRSDVFGRLNFANKSLTEDFDVTLQLYRQRMGKIQFIPEAVAYTQDPRTIRDYINQITRWNRGIMQGIKRHKIGLRASRIDAYLVYQIMQNLLFFVNYCLILPLLAYVNHTTNIFASTFLLDVAITFGITLAIATKTQRWDILSAYPHIYMLRWISLLVFLRSFVEVFVLRKFRVSESIWSTDGRRYKSAAATSAY